jgi:hypothetical protein
MNHQQIRKLHSGDEVKWNDPDNGERSRILKIQSIVHLEDHAYLIVTVEGDCVEVFDDELE